MINVLRYLQQLLRLGKTTPEAALYNRWFETPQSSCIRRIRLLPARRSLGRLSNVLEIQFVNGRYVSYIGVPEMVFWEFLQAPSKGRYFNAALRGRYVNSQRFLQAS